MQELGKFNLKIKITPNGLEKYMSFSINNTLSFIDSFQFSLDSVAINLNKDDFKYFGQEFDNNVLDLVRQKEFYPYEYPNGHIFVDLSSIRRRNSPWKVRQNYIDFERRIYVEIMTSIRCGNFDVDSTFKIDKISMSSPRGFFYVVSTSN